MSYRRHPGKPTTLLWILVAAADLALLVASVGVVLVVALAGVAAGAVAALLGWRALRRAPQRPLTVATTRGPNPVRRRH
ncbi:MAG TPA: hypothetical protein VNV66_00945 [Pilimelia sp.]|nr:hypothetical protein [Pilimelia sp.]